MRKLHIKTYGCQMNVYDSERMVDILKPLGYELSDEVEGSDLIILNTCHIREKATEKLFSDLGRVKKVTKDKASIVGSEYAPIVAVAGCVAQAQGKEIVKRMPWVDMVFGPQNYHELPKMIAEVHRSLGSKAVLQTDFPPEIKFDYLPEPSSVSGRSSFLAIQEGCDKFCTYCVVPYTRGAEYSRSLQSVLSEISTLVAQGVVELTLLGQNVNAWHGMDEDNDKQLRLSDLIYEISKINEIKRIRYTTSYPAEMTDDLLGVHGSIDKLMPYLHLPVQSGSNRILKAMNRSHTREEYIDIISRLRKLRPDIAISGDFIVGFPGESEKDFNDTLELVEEVKYASSYSFKYSLRAGTPASLMPNQIDEDIKSERLSILQKLLNEQSTRFNQDTVGKVLPVLFERAGRKSGQLVGRSPYMQAVYIDDAIDLMGKICNVKIVSSSSSSLRAEL